MQDDLVLFRLIRFCIVGGITAIIHYGILYLCVEFLASTATVASSFGFVIAVICNYLLHYSWTFGETAPHGQTLLRYLVMISCGFVINGGLMWLGSEFLQLNYLLAQAIALVAVLIWNFSLAQLWVFAAKGSPRVGG